MEVIFELLFELFGEVLLQVVLEALAEAGLHLVKRDAGAPQPARPVLRGIGYLLMGAVAGAISLWLFPHSFMRSSLGRVASLLLSPVAGGLAMALLGAWRARRGQAVLGLDRFVYGYVFALALALVRFHWAH